MRRIVRIGLAFACLLITAFAPQFVPGIPKVNAASQTVQNQLSWMDLLSGGMWARLNHLENNTAILSLADAAARINPRSLSATSSYQDPPGIFSNNFRVTGGSGFFPMEDEPSIAVTNQSGHVLMVVGANRLSTQQMPAYVSRDQGATWLGPFFLSLSRANDSFTSDPGLAVNRAGTFFYSFLSIGSSNSINPPDDIVVATSSDGGNWTNHVAVQRRPFRNNFTSTVLYDKPYITTGPNATNPLQDNVYVTYTNFTAPYFCCNLNTTIMQVHSFDGGLTWSVPNAISPSVAFINSFSGPSGGRVVQGSMPAVDPRNGDVYVAYYDSGKDGYLNGTAKVMIAKSSNGGRTFSAPAQAALIPQQLTFCSDGGSGPCRFGSFRWASSMFPSMDVAPDGTVYIVYGARAYMGSPDPADIYLVTSTDGGLTWNLPVKVNDDTSQNGAFFAWLKVSSDGVVHTIWGDRRTDPLQIGYDIFYAQATNHGTTIGANIRVTDVGTDVGQTIPFVGDYFNIAVSGNQVYPVWTDGRRAIRPFGRYILFGETDIYMARIGPRDTPTITVGASPPAGFQALIPISGSGLPRDSYFMMRMNEVPLNSQHYFGISLFFSDKSGSLSDEFIPNSNYYGAFPVELDEWLSGAQLANTYLYIVDTRNLGVLVTGPSTAHPGDSFTWNIQLIRPSGSLNPQGFSSTLSVTSAQLIYPNGTVQDLTISVVPTGPSSFSLAKQLPTISPSGIYILSIQGSQIGKTVQSNGIGTATFAVSPRDTSMSVSCTPTAVQSGDTTLCLTTVTDTTPGSASSPTGTITWTTSGTGSFSSTKCTLSGTGSSASCWVTYVTKGSAPEVITASYSGSPILPSSTMSTALDTIPSSQSAASLILNNTLLLGLIAAGAGAVGLAIGIAGTMMARKGKRTP